MIKGGLQNLPFAETSLQERTTVNLEYYFDQLDSKYES